MSGEQVTYATAGVDTEAGDKAVELMKDAVRATHGPQVLGGVGGFAGLYDASALLGYRKPLLEPGVLPQRCGKRHEAALLDNIAVSPDRRNGHGGKQETQDGGQGRDKGAQKKVLTGWRRQSHHRAGYRTTDVSPGWYRLWIRLNDRRHSLE